MGEMPFLFFSYKMVSYPSFGFSVIEGMIESKTYIIKVDFPIVFDLFSDPVGHFGLGRRRGVADGVALRAVSECPRRRNARLVCV